MRTRLVNPNPRSPPHPAGSRGAYSREGCESYSSERGRYLCSSLHLLRRLAVLRRSRSVAVEGRRNIHRRDYVRLYPATLCCKFWRRRDMRFVGRARGAAKGKQCSAQQKSIVDRVMGT